MLSHQRTDREDILHTKMKSMFDLKLLINLFRYQDIYTYEYRNKPILIRCKHTYTPSYVCIYEHTYV